MRALCAYGALRLAGEGGPGQGRRSDLAHGTGRAQRQDARKLSGGERQRAFLAMTVAQGARTLLLDEPTTSLDVRAALDLMQLVRRLADEQGTTIVCVTHDVDLALRFSDGICVLGSARPTQLLAEGTPEEIAGSSVLAASLGISAVRFAHAGDQTYGIFPTDAV